MKSEWAMTVPVISTGHAPSDADISNLTEYGCLVAEYEFGYFVYLQDEPFDSEPEWLTGIRLWWLEHYGTNEDSTWIRFDSAGDVIDELQRWEW